MTEAFLACLRCFVSRRGLPTEIHSDNSSNFKGAKNDLCELYHFLQKDSTQSAVHSYLLSQCVQWHCIPERAPHFGSLWEAAVKSAKFHLKRVIGSQHLHFEDFTTISSQVESCLNSRPITSLSSPSCDGISALTPGHFLIGKPLRAYPGMVITTSPSTLRRWTLCQNLIQHFWQ